MNCEKQSDNYEKKREKKNTTQGIYLFGDKHLMVKNPVKNSAKLIAKSCRMDSMRRKNSEEVGSMKLVKSEKVWR